MTDEENFRSLITEVASGANEDELQILLDDVLWFTAWYGSSSPDEVQFSSGESLSDLIGKDNKRVLLAKAIRYYTIKHLPSNGNIDRAVLETMDRIVNWKDWLPAWLEDQNWKAYNEESQAYEAAYYQNDGYGDENVLGEFDDF